MFSLGEGCSHSAAILFKVECAVRHGYTSVTSNLCGWNQVFSTKVMLFCNWYVYKYMHFFSFQA